MQKLNAAQDILAVTVSARVGHEFHEHGEILSGGWQDVNAKISGEIEPLSDVRQDIVLGRSCEPEPLCLNIL